MKSRGQSHHNHRNGSDNDHHHGGQDPAAAKLIAGIRKSMIAGHDPQNDHQNDGNEDKLIRDNIQNYLSKAD